MKRIYLIGGTMGVDKTTVCQQLKQDLPNSIFLDGDWCWDANPFQVTQETKAMVTDNICHLLNNFTRCSAYENVIFCWVMHQQSIIDSIVEKLDARGIRTDDVIARSVARLPLYTGLDTIRIDTSGRTVRDIAGDTDIQLKTLRHSLEVYNMKINMRRDYVIF